MPKLPISTKSFFSAFEALSELSIYLQYLHKNTLIGSYRCPLRPNQLADNKVRQIIDEIKKLDSKIERIHQLASDEAFEKIDPSLRKAACRERDSAISNGWDPNKYWGGSDRAKMANIQTDLGKKIANRLGIQVLIDRRNRLVHSLYERHSQALQALNEFLPASGGNPISMNEAHDSLDYFVRIYCPVDKLQSRVKRLSEDIDKAREFYQKSRLEKKSPSEKGKKIKRRKRASTYKPPTDRQLQIFHIFSECKGNYSEAARRLGLDRKTVEEACKVVFKKTGLKLNKLKYKPLPLDRRGQVSLPDQ